MSRATWWYWFESDQWRRRILVSYVNLNKCSFSMGEIHWWCYCIESESQQPHSQDMKGPMAEVDFWWCQHVVFSDILVQVEEVEIKKSLEILRLGDSSMYNKLQEKINDWTNFLLEAMENAIFFYFGATPSNIDWWTFWRTCYNNPIFNWWNEDDLDSVLTL